LSYINLRGALSYVRSREGTCSVIRWMLALLIPSGDGLSADFGASAAHSTVLLMSFAMPAVACGEENWPLS
jgi:hypothetical protein